MKANSYSLYDLSDNYLCLGVFKSLKSIAAYIRKPLRELKIKKPIGNKYAIERNYRG